MSIILTKSLSVDFPRGIELNDLHSQLLIQFGSNFTGINVTEDHVELFFVSPLLAEDIIAINTIISNHLLTEIKTKGSNFRTFYPKTNKFRLSYYQLLGSIPYKRWDITHMKIHGGLENSANSYAIMIYDSINDKVIAEKTISSGSTYEECDLGEISNLPNADGQFEILAKIINPIKGAICTLDYIIIYYN